LPISSTQLREALTAYAGEEGLNNVLKSAEVIPLTGQTTTGLAVKNTRFFRQASHELQSDNPISELLHYLERTGNKAALHELLDQIGHLGVLDIGPKINPAGGSSIELTQLVLIHRCSISQVLGIESDHVE